MGPRLVLILLLSIEPASLFAADVYAAPDESDAAPGTKDKPLQGVKAVGDGFVLPGPSGQLRAHFVGSPRTGFDLVFERNKALHCHQESGGQYMGLGIVEGK